MKWLRLYHDTITDPKWRVVAIDSGQPEAVVLGVWMAMLVNASDSPVRGTLHDWNDRFMGGALGLKGDVVAAIRQAMQGVVLDGDVLTGWDKRQRTTDNVAERVKRHRQRHPKPNGPTGGGNGNGTLQDEDVTLHAADVTGCNVSETLPPLKSDSIPTVIQAETKEEEDARARATPAASALGEQIAAMVLEKTGLPLKSRDATIIDDWLKEGADPDGDVMPAVEAAMGRTKQVRIRGFAYFTDEVLNHHAQRTAPKPEGKSNVQRFPTSRAQGSRGAFAYFDKHCADFG